MSARLLAAQARSAALDPRRGVQRRNSLLVVTLDVLRVLRRGRWTVEELAAEARVHVRTAYRTLNALEAAGLLLERHQEGPHAHYRVTDEALAAWLEMAPPAARLGAAGGKAGTAAQLAQRRAAAVRGGRPRLALPCRRCGTPTTERDRSRRADCGAH